MLYAIIIVISKLKELNLLFSKVCLAYNSHKPHSLILAQKFELEIQKLDCQCFYLPLGVLEAEQVSAQNLQDLNLTIVFGGDGTLLSAVHKLAEYNIPILGINAGHLGFLSEAQNPECIKSFLGDIWDGKFRLESRTMLSAEIIRGNSPDQEPEKVLALNDIVISRSSRSHVLKINLEIDNSKIIEYTADGLIVCTPTGSTAYYLSAGGSVLAPNISGLGIIPICAHSLTSRPLIVSDRSALKLSLIPRSRQSLITLQADGQETFLLEPEDSVIIHKAKAVTTLMRSLNPANNFYKVLSRKLLWGRENS